MICEFFFFIFLVAMFSATIQLKELNADHVHRAMKVMEKRAHNKIFATTAHVHQV